MHKKNIERNQGTFGNSKFMKNLKNIKKSLGWEKNVAIIVVRLAGSDNFASRFLIRRFTFNVLISPVSSASVCEWREFANRMPVV